jgi:hypothetical protein
MTALLRRIAEGGCADWFTTRVTTLGELDEAMKAARASSQIGIRCRAR